MDEGAAGLFVGGAVFGIAGGIFKVLSSFRSAQVRHLRSVKTFTVPELAEELASLPKGSRIYGATEGLLTPQGHLYTAENGDQVIYSRTAKVEKLRSWKWKQPRDKNTEGYWKADEQESGSVENNVSFGGLGIFSQGAFCVVDPSVAKAASAALERKTSERFEAKVGGGTTVIVNNNNGRRHTNRERPPPPESLGFKKTEYTIPNGALAFTVGSFGIQTDHVSVHQTQQDSTAPPTGSYSRVTVSEVRDQIYDEANGVQPAFMIGYGTLAGDIRRRAKISDALNLVGNISLAIGGGCVVGGIAKYVASQNRGENEA